MIEVHHLNNSRSQRILWLLEELGLPYEIVAYERSPETMLAPEALRAIHPLGKSPVVRDGDQVVHESGAIIEYVLEKYGNGRMAPRPGTPERTRYLQLMHYAEGSAMLPLILKLYAGRLGDAAQPLLPRIHSEIENHLGYLEGELSGRDWFVGAEPSGADVQLAFVAQTAKLLYGLQKFPNLTRFLERVHARPAYRRAIERGGPYAFGS